MHDISKPTLSDGTAGGIEPGAITFELCKNNVDHIYLLSEAEIANAMRWMIQTNQIIIEGAAALSIALVLKHPQLFQEKHSALVLCGRRLSHQKLHLILSENKSQ